jgi:hypothetical protein
MSQRDYELIANVLKDLREDGYNYDALNAVSRALCARFSRSNSRFNTTKFLKACGVMP